MATLIDLGRDPIPVSSAQRSLGATAKLEAIWPSYDDGGLEIGLLTADVPLSPGSMRSAWDKRREGRPIPLMLLQPIESGYRVCGPEGAKPSVRDLPEKVIVAILRRALGLTPDVVVDALRAELARGVGSGGVSGLLNNGLVSTHYLVERLPQDQTRWPAMGRDGSPALNREGRDIFASLGYEITAPADGELLLRHLGAPIALVHAYRGAHLLDRFVDDIGTPASAYVLARARTHGAPYGMLVAGTVARLLSQKASSELGESAPSAAFLEIATDLLPPDRAGIVGACYAPDALREGGYFTFVREASERYAVALRNRFRERVYQHVVPGLVAGIARSLRAQRIAVDTRVLYRATMLALFRTLFVLYAEDRDLLPMASPLYRQHSLTERIEGVRQALAGRGFDPRATDLWDDLKRIFAAVAGGHVEWGVPAYDGGLFVDDAAHSPDGALLGRLQLLNRDFGPALHGLAIDTDPESGSDGKVDFGDLGVRHIGNLYEGLLSYEVAIADEDLAVDADKPDQPYVPARRGQTIAVPAGEPYMRSPKGGRKASGSYYTPTFVVDRIVSQSVVSALDRHLASLDADDTTAAERLWDFRVCDPAMGSGHFLVSVVDAIAERLASYLVERPIVSVREEMERARLQSHKTNEAAGATEVAEVKDVDVLRRLVLKRCV